MSDNYVFEKPAECNLFPAIGGGDGYDPDAFTVDTDHPCGDRVARDQADIIVSSASEMPDNPADGTVIWLEGDATIDLGSSRFTYDADDLVIASDRGMNGSHGALVRTSQRVHPQITINGDRCRVTSFRQLGPEPEIFDGDIYPASTGLSANGARLEIDNMVYRGWTHAGVEVGRESYPNWIHIHHCDFVDNHSKGLGYGVTVFHGKARIRACYFDNNRHSIAGSGDADCAWRLLDSIVGEHQRLHALDMHGDGDGNAGLWVVARRNVLLPTHNWYGTDGPSQYGQETLSIRGIPREPCHIENNAFTNQRPSEPMRGSDNAAVNVHGASTFSEGKLVGIDTNVFEWQSGDHLPDDVGPVRDEAVTGFGLDEGNADEEPLPPTSDSMSNPTADKSGTYEVTVYGNGDTKSVFLLVAADGLAEFEDTLERNDYVAGRAALGYVSTITDKFVVEGPVEIFKNVGGDPGITLEVDGERYPPEAFEPDPVSDIEIPESFDFTLAIEGDGSGTWSFTGHDAQ